MDSNTFNTMQEQLEKMMTPASRLNAVMMDHLTRLADFQMKTAKSYGELMMENMKDLGSVSDLESLQEYAGRQPERLSEAGKRLADDLRALAEMGTELKEEIEGVFREPAESDEDEAPTAA